jgi:hypothetical protein
VLVLVLVVVVVVVVLVLKFLRVQQMLSLPKYLVDLTLRFISILKFKMSVYIYDVDDQEPIYADIFDLYLLLFSRNSTINSYGTFWNVYGSKKLTNMHKAESDAKIIITGNPFSRHKSIVYEPNMTTPSPTRETTLVPMSRAWVGNS